MSSIKITIKDSNHELTVELADPDIVIEELATKAVVLMSELDRGLNSTI